MLHDCRMKVFGFIYFSLGRGVPGCKYWGFWLYKLQSWVSFLVQSINLFIKIVVCTKYLVSITLDLGPMSKAAIEEDVFMIEDVGVSKAFFEVNLKNGEKTDQD